MDERAFRISLASLVESKTETESEEKNREVLDEQRIKELAQDALKSYYPTFLHSHLRNLNINELISLMFIIVSQFGKSEPQKLLNQTLTPLKTKILNNIGDAALLEKGSLLDKVCDYFRENPPDTTSDVETYVKQMLTKIRNNTKRSVPKLERVVTQI